MRDSIAHYKIISAIGAGGMGEVFFARDAKLDRKVAIKVLLDEVGAAPMSLGGKPLIV